MGRIDLKAVAEPWSHSVRSSAGSLTLTGNSRAYLMLGERLSPFHLLGKTLRFSVDVHDVPCSVNAALYFVARRNLHRVPVQDYCVRTHAESGTQAFATPMTGTSRVRALSCGRAGYADEADSVR